MLCSVRFDIQPGREGVIDFKSSSESMVYRAKNGHLLVVSVYYKCASTLVFICQECSVLIYHPGEYRFNTLGTTIQMPLKASITRFKSVK